MSGGGRLAAAALLVVGDALAGSDVDVGFRVISRDAAAHALLDLAGHGQEGLLDVASVLGRGLKEGDAEGIGEFLTRSASCGERQEGMLRLGTLATVYSTTFLSAISLLFPTSSLLTPSVAYLSISCSHCLTLLKLSMSVTS